jgi:hypothetical protein
MRLFLVLVGSLEATRDRSRFSHKGGEAAYIYICVKWLSDSGGNIGIFSFFFLFVSRKEKVWKYVKHTW